MNNDKKYKGHITVLMANIIWGLNAPIAKSVLDSSITPLSLTTFRCFGAAIIFWLLSIFTKREHVCHEDLLRLFFASLFGIVLNQGTFVFGLSLTSPINASIICTMAPIVTMIVAALYLKEPVTGKKVIGIFLGATGAMLLILSGHSVTTGKAGNIWGDLLCLASQLSFAIYLTVFKDLFGRYSTVTLMKWMFIYSSICLTPFSYSDVAAINFSAVSLHVYGGIAFVVLGSTCLAYLLVMIGQQNLRPTIVSMYNYIQPIVASFIAVTIGMDTLGWSKAGAIVLVFLGVYIVTQSRSKAQMDAYILTQNRQRTEEERPEELYRKDLNQNIKS
ncbi:DMT family transporter [Bacteroides sedimenti]|uniref:Membrane protein n=1 Tax=Bacteroides sedimenti TaxID=2136147 RepID=A0ABM8I9Q4_9BACE